MLVSADASFAILVTLATRVEAADTSVDVRSAILNALRVGRALVAAVIWVDVVVGRAFPHNTRGNLDGKTTVGASAVEVD